MAGAGASGRIDGGRLLAERALARGSHRQDRYLQHGHRTGRSDYEAVYFLDHLTGDLRAFVVGRLANGGFGVLQYCYRNVLQDFKTEGEKTPKFIMATGICDLNRAVVAGTSCRAGPCFMLPM